MKKGMVLLPPMELMLAAVLIGESGDAADHHGAEQQRAGSGDRMGQDEGVLDLRVAGEVPGRGR